MAAVDMPPVDRPKLSGAAVTGIGIIKTDTPKRAPNPTDVFKKYINNSVEALAMIP